MTGAGTGLGRAHALELAGLGARVVVNDLGTRADGGGSDEAPGRAVVEEIEKRGGEAIAHFGDVANWNDARALIQSAVDTYGDLNILVNNAGFLRDKMIFSMSEQDFDDVMRVHVKGHFCTLRFATAYWRETSKAKGAPIYGRIISSSSEAFILGSAGQPNYAAAKAGIVALTGAAARACLKYGVTANTIMPRARTRMTEAGGMGAAFAKPAEGFDAFAPENVSPLVGYLASPHAARISGNVFIIWGKSVTILGPPSAATTLVSDEPWTAIGLQERLGPHFEKLEPIADSFLVTAFR